MAILTITYLSRSQDIIHVFQKSFILDFIISEDESDSLSLLACCSVEDFQIINKIARIIGSKGNREIDGFDSLWIIKKLPNVSFFNVLHF